MTLANPLPVSEFWDLLRPQEVLFQDFEPVQIDRTASGQILKASAGDSLWQGTVTIYPDTDYTRAMRLEARLSVAARAGMSVLAYDHRRKYPADDPTGSKLGAATPTIWTVPDNRRLRLQGLPENYVITDGDLIGLTYGSSPVRYSLHRVVVGGTATNTGAPNDFGTPIMEVTPFLPPEAAVDVAVSLIKPSIKVSVTDANFGGGVAGRVLGPSFSFAQTMR